MLNIRSYNVFRTTTLAIESISNSSWNEYTITYGNQPAVGNILTSNLVTTSFQW